MCCILDGWFLIYSFLKYCNLNLIFLNVNGVKNWFNKILCNFIDFLYIYNLKFFELINWAKVIISLFRDIV